MGVDREPINNCAVQCQEGVRPRTAAAGAFSDSSPLPERIHDPKSPHHPAGLQVLAVEDPAAGIEGGLEDE